LSTEKPRVVGLGTRLGRDDEVGLALVEALARDPNLETRCELLEGADAAVVAAFLIERRAPVILVDAAEMGIPPGEHRLFAEHEAEMVLKSGAVSTHGLGLAEGLALARALGSDQPVQIFGVQPFDLSPGSGLTPEMGAMLPKLLAALREASRFRQDVSQASPRALVR
jgi:hydrogenase maturation protease